MKNYLPAFKQLTAFESVARNYSFTRAANELKLTHSAVSQNIKSLEKELETTLFERTTHSVKLTPLGEAYYNEICNALALIRNATKQLIVKESSLTVNMPTSFAAKWFTPRLENFTISNPYIDLRICTLRRNITEKDFKDKQIDISIEYGLSNNWPKCRIEKIMPDNLIAVAAPTIIKNKQHSIKSLFSSLKCIIISSNLRKNDYKIWCDTAGIPEPNISSQIYYTATPQALNAATEGEGIIITHKILVVDAIKRGVLMQISNIEVATEEAYYLIYPEYDINFSAVSAFKQWIHLTL
jgi:LysR family transcriptional regulator, glycine cleavage system transcriptional activator